MLLKAKVEKKEVNQLKAEELESIRTFTGQLIACMEIGPNCLI